VLGQAILSVRVVLEQQRAHIGAMPTLQWIPFAADLAAVAARCVPVSTRETDIFSLWFFVLDLIQDNRWIGGKKADESVKLFQRHVTLFSNPSSIQQILLTSKAVGTPAVTPSAQTQLAARACLLFLDRALVAKKPAGGLTSLSHDRSALTRSGGMLARSGGLLAQESTDEEGGSEGGSRGAREDSANELNIFPSNVNVNSSGEDLGVSPLLEGKAGKRERELMEQAEKLYALKSDPAYVGYDAFFSQIQNILSPLFDLAHFKIVVVRSLAPIALYLEIL